MEQERQEWLEKQMMQIPIEYFIELRLQVEKAKAAVDDEMHKRWHLETQLDEAKESLAEAKAQIRQLIGLDEANRLADLQFEKGVIPDVDDGR